MKRGSDQVIFNIIGYGVLGLIAGLMIVPFGVLIGSSFASEQDIVLHGYSIIPRDVSLEAYGLIFENPQKLLQAYGVTILITVVGTGVSLFISAMSAYVLSRKSLRYRNGLAFFLYFTILFPAPLLPYFILITNVLHLRNTLLVLILVPMFYVMYLFILRSFIKSIPDSMFEAAQIDGAGEFRIFIQIVLPLMKPALASIGLFLALRYWNDWWTAMMFVDKEPLQPLQYALYRILSSVNAAAHLISNVPTFEMPKETLKLAMTVVSTGPIILIYPFVQRFFVKGVTLGAVKG